MSAPGKFAKKLLDMSEEARLKRAEDMGFFPNTVFHGTAVKENTVMKDGNIFDEFKKFEGEDLSRSTSRSPVGKLGISVAEDPELAESFSRLASPDGNEGAAILPLKFRAQKVGQIDLDGTESNAEIYSTVVDAWNQDFDAIRFTNYTTPAGETGKNFVLVRDTNQLRSINAAFDPAKKESSKMLAGTAATALGIGGLSSEDASAFVEPTGKFSEGLLEAYIRHNQNDLSRTINALPDTIEAPKREWAARAAHWLRGYNKARGERLAPVLDILLPAGELPADLMDKIAYDDERSVMDYAKATLEAL